MHEKMGVLLVFFSDFDLDRPKRRAQFFAIGNSHLGQTLGRQSYLKLRTPK